MYTLQDYDNMMVDTVIAQGTAVNGTGRGNDTTPYMSNVVPGASYTWIAKRLKGGWKVLVNGNEQSIRHMTTIRKLVDPTEEALTFYLYD
jgi:hypothetical protein